MLKLRKRKGMIYNFIMATVALITVTMVWMIGHIIIIDQLKPVILNQTSNPSAIKVINSFSIIWNVWPFIIIVALILFLIVSAQKREYDTFGR